MFQFLSSDNTNCINDHFSISDDFPSTRYESMIEYEPTFPAPYKRKVAILKAQNKISDAVNDLNRYLNTFR